MRTPRFFVDLALAPGASVALPAEVAHHARRVLRLNDGAEAVLFNGRGGEYVARLWLTAAPPAAEVLGFERVERESPLAITLIQALVSADKLDWVLEKATELGAAHLVLTPTERSVARLDPARLARKLAHWREVTVAACAQCGRNRLPSIVASESLAGALHDTEATARFVLAPGGAGRLTDAAAESVAVAIGPEGGFTEAELALAGRYGFARVALGPRVLRTETAGLAAIVALQARDGDFTQ